MDTSETYIKMADHPKIQEQKLKILFAVSKVSNEFSISYQNKEIWINHEGSFFFKGEVWLPRQEEIQKMIISCGLIFDNPYDYCYHIWKFACRYKISLDLFRFGTMEQLWLIFYMYEKHGLLWDGKEWKDDS